MQDQYCGDVGDFGKYGLLRWVCRDTHLCLGVNWYLVPNESGNADGRHTRYLDPTEENKRRFGECDGELWKALGQIVGSPERCVRRIRTDGILPRDTVFYEDRLEWGDDMKATSSEGRRVRVAHRQAWAKEGRDLLQDCKLVFFDPDNGLETETNCYAARGPKYVFVDEIGPYFRRGQSLVIYQHLGRNGKANVQVRSRLKQIQDAVKSIGSFALLYHRGTARAFLIVPTREHVSVLRAAAEDFLASDWGKQGHFEMVE